MTDIKSKMAEAPDLFVSIDPVDSGNKTREKDVTNSESLKKQSQWRKVLGVFWDSVDGEQRDRKFVQKLDTFLL
jgi:hypothetical protein